MHHTETLSLMSRMGWLIEYKHTCTVLSGMGWLTEYKHTCTVLPILWHSTYTLSTSRQSFPLPMYPYVSSICSQTTPDLNVGQVAKLAKVFIQFCNVVEFWWNLADFQRRVGLSELLPLETWRTAHSDIKSSVNGKPFLNCNSCLKTNLFSSHKKR